MARPPATPQPLIRTSGQTRRALKDIEDCIQSLNELDPDKVNKRYNDPLTLGVEAEIKAALSTAFGHDTPDYKQYVPATKLDTGSYQARGGSVFGREDYTDYDARDARDARKYVAEGKERALSLLEQARKRLAKELEYSESDESARLGEWGYRTMLQPSRTKIFLVHGHDRAAQQEAARFLEKLGLEPIILDEQPNAGLTIIEKFEKYAGQAGYAVILLTPDDLGGAKVAVDQRERARQNVIFELGFFVGKLGRGRTCLLHKGHLEIPSDLLGVVYTPLDEAQGWQSRLVKEMKEAGLDFDANKMWD